MAIGLMRSSSDRTSISACLAGAVLRDLVPVPSRAAWSALSDTRRDALVAAAGRAQSTPWPDLPAALYRRFCEDGDRVAFETPYFARRSKLNALVLGEAVEGRGWFLEDIECGVALICDEAAWQLPAHNREVRSGVIRPEPTRHIVDLFAAETAAQLALVHALIGGAMRLQIEQAVRERVLSPYLQRSFWWMGLEGGRMNNWTVWCTQNVLIAAFTLPLSVQERQQIVARAGFSLDAFLAGYGEDGACPEGVYYYGHAALCLFTALDVLNAVTDGAVTPLFQTDKLRNIAEFLLYAHISGTSYANFGDSAAQLPGPDHRVGQFAAAVGSSRLAGFAARFGAGDRPDTLNLYDRLQAIFAKPVAGGHRPVEGFLPSIGMYVARDDAFYVAANAGHNGADHNHNDVGNLIVYRNGAPVLIDVGVETYSAKTFSRDRYDIWTMQSSYHNLPEIGGVMQCAGTEFSAREVTAHHGTNIASLDMDISGAYPPEAGLVLYHRRIVLERGRAVRVTDTFQADRPVTLNLMLAEKPRQDGDKITVGDSATLRLTGAASVATEQIAIIDPRLAQSWSGPLYRLRITPVANQIEVVIT